MEISQAGGPLDFAEPEAQVLKLPLEPREGRSVLLAITKALFCDDPRQAVQLLAPQDAAPWTDGSGWQAGKRKLHYWRPPAMAGLRDWRVCFPTSRAIFIFSS
jgi:hypothetical protein